MFKLAAFVLIAYVAGAPVPSTMLPDPMTEPMRAFHRDLNEGLGALAFSVGQVGIGVLGVDKLARSVGRSTGLRG